MQEVNRNGSKLPRPEEVIPHRPPHLWLDSVYELSPSSAKGYWRPGEEHFGGHFEGLPILPGVKMVESLAQISAYTVMSRREGLGVPIFKAIEYANFREPVKPGNTLDLEVTITDLQNRTFRSEGIVKVGGILACNASITGAVLSERASQRLIG